MVRIGSEATPTRITDFSSASMTESVVATSPISVLWGTPVTEGERGTEIRNLLKKLCSRLGENPQSYSEPDAIVDLASDGLIFFETKYRSGNDHKAANYVGWPKCTIPVPALGLTWQPEDVRASGCYELARNWCIIKNLAGGRSAKLVNLGLAGLFQGDSGARIDHFVQTLGKKELSNFVKLTWSKLLENEFANAPGWFVSFCQSRKLLDANADVKTFLPHTWDDTK